MLEIVIPQAVHGEAKHDRNEIVLSVKPDGSYWLDQDRKVTLAEFEAELDRHPDKLLNIYMDKKADFGSFVAVLDLAKIKRNGRFVISTKADKAKAADE